MKAKPDDDTVCEWVFGWDWPFYSSAEERISILTMPHRLQMLHTLHIKTEIGVELSVCELLGGLRARRWSMLDPTLPR